MIIELKYSNTNTYLISSEQGYLLFDTGWAGTFPLFCKALGEANVKISDIKYIIISHFHPDHMGIAQNIADLGAKIVVFDVQKEYIHSSDSIFAKEKGLPFIPVDDNEIVTVQSGEAASFLKSIGIEGQILHTPGHSDDSISLLTGDGSLFVGDLNPLYELELHEGTVIGDSWKMLLEANPTTVYYGHAKTGVLTNKM